MSEFIGSRISLISKSDIRYVGTLHEINSENSTVALEQVVSFGTEGRRNSPDDEISGSDAVYEYIVFRGSDVKDLRIEEPPKENKPPPPPQMPNDPAILGSGSRPPPPSNASQQLPRAPPQQPQQPAHFQQPPPYPYQQYNQFPPQQRFGGPQPGFPGPPPGAFHGYPGMPYGAPPGWYPPPGQGFPQQQGPGPFSPQPPHLRGPGSHPEQQQQQPQQQQQQQQRGPPPPSLPVAELPPSSGPANGTSQRPSEAQPSASQQVEETVKPSTSEPDTERAGPMPKESKADVLAGPVSAAPKGQPRATPKPATSGPRGGRIMPAMPLASPARAAIKPVTPAQTSNGTAAIGAPVPALTPATPASQYQNATQQAAAAVAAAMAKLPPMPGQAAKPAGESNAMDNLSRKVNEMRTDDRIRHSRQPGTGGYAAGNRGGRGGRGRGGREQSKGLEVPKTDFDFESSNAQFIKQEVVKENSVLDSPLGTPTGGETGLGSQGNSSTNGAIDVSIPVAAQPSYNKSSFFDDISSEAKDREDASAGRRAGGQEFRSEERRRNLETFGLGSVDGGFRGGFRGRGRGRGLRGGPGRGIGGGGRGAPRGGVSTQQEGSL